MRLLSEPAADRGRCRVLLAFLLWCAPVFADDTARGGPPDWPQWRGPTRDGMATGPRWPARLGPDALKQRWRVKLGPSYSGPIVVADRVFTTETRNRTSEVVYALDRQTGDTLWQTAWKGGTRVPFFAAANGSWIRSTPACDGECLYVAGMRDVLVCLECASGKERWRVDFVKKFGAPVPSFGFVCSPLVDGNAVYVQAGAAVVKLDKTTGRVLWRTLKDGGGMFGSAFSSPVIAAPAGRRQLVVQTRRLLAGADLETGRVLWTQEVPAFRGMNILTPVVVGDTVFTSSYRNKSWRYEVSRNAGRFAVRKLWSNTTRGYMSTPVVIDGHVYLHLQNRRFACLRLDDGTPTWKSGAFGKYASLVAQGDRILALSCDGRLLLIGANPQRCELVDEVKIDGSQTWAHLAVSGNELFVRELGAIAAYRWTRTRPGR